MSKTTHTLAATLLAGIALSSTAHADAVRVGFGFPLGSFVAHSNETYSSRDYRPAEHRRIARRDVRGAAPVHKVGKLKRPQKTETAEAPAKAAPVRTVKLEDKLTSEDATTNKTEKAAVAKSDTPTTTASGAPAATTPVVNDEKLATAEKSTTAETAASPSDSKHVCRRYLPAVAALTDVPCE